jgi:hypothetical protein
MLAHERIRIDSQFPSQFHIDFYDARCRNWRWVHTRVEALRKPRECIVERETELAGEGTAEARTVSGDVWRSHPLLDVGVLFQSHPLRAADATQSHSGAEWSSFLQLDLASVNIDAEWFRLG